MDSTTPHQLITNSLETLRSAAALLRSDEDHVLLHGIEKAVGILEIVVPGLQENAPEDKADEKSESFSYTPEALPVAALLTPIASEKPAGENIRVTGEVNELLSLVVNRAQASDFRPQYRALRQKAEDLLMKRGKDLGVAVRLIEAALTEEEKSGFAAVADGLLLINGLFSTFWDGLFPECIDGDCEARGNELKQCEELLIMQLSARYGKPHEYAPAFADMNTATHEAAIFKLIMEQLDLLDRTTYVKFKDQAPSLSELRSVLGTYKGRVDTQHNVFKQRIEEEREEAKRRREQEISMALEKLAKETAAQEAEDGEGSSMDAIEPHDMSDAGNRLDACARFLILHAPGDPVGYMIHRGQRWFSRSFEVAANGPSSDQRQKIIDLFSAKQWNELLQNAEELFAAGGHRWLDLQRYEVIAAGYLGPEYKAVADYLCRATARYVSDNKEILDEKMDDLAPLASTETAEWIRYENAVNAGHGPDTNICALSEAVFANEIQKAEELAGKGKAGAALNLLLTRQYQARSRRERFLWQLSIAEFCVRMNLTKVALPGIENMVETIDRLNLAEWEDPDILLRAYKIGYDGYLSLGGENASEDKLDYFYRRICLFDPGHFVSSAEG